MESGSRGEHGSRDTGRAWVFMGWKKIFTLPKLEINLLIQPVYRIWIELCSNKPMTKCFSVQGVFEHNADCVWYTCTISYWAWYQIGYLTPGLGETLSSSRPVAYFPQACTHLTKSLKSHVVWIVRSGRVQASCCCFSFPLCPLFDFTGQRQNCHHARCFLCFIFLIFNKKKTGSWII